jgi:hypothetical protein
MKQVGTYIERQAGAGRKTARGDMIALTRHLPE